jgi:hypothetical protein
MNICEHNQLYSGFVGSVLAAILAAILILVAWYQLEKINITSSADFYHKLVEDFFTPRARTLIMLIEWKALEFKKPENKSGDNKPEPFFKVDIDTLEKSNVPEALLKPLRKKTHYTMWEIDDFLISPLTDVGMLERKGLIDFEMARIGFRYYLDVVWSCDEIKKYIEYERCVTGVKHIKGAVAEPFQYIAEKCREYSGLPARSWSWSRIWWWFTRQFLGLRKRLEVHVHKCNDITLPHNGVFTRLCPSKIHGIGVFAIRDIPKDTYIFSGDNSKVVWVKKSEIQKQDAAIKQLYDDFCIIQGNTYGCPDNFNNLNVGWYLNESKKNPNVRCDPNYDFYALRDIKTGEELTVNYSTFSEYPNQQ